MIKTAIAFVALVTFAGVYSSAAYAEDQAEAAAQTDTRLERFLERIQDRSNDHVKRLDDHDAKIKSNTDEIEALKAKVAAVQSATPSAPAPPAPNAEVANVSAAPPVYQDSRAVRNTTARNANKTYTYYEEHPLPNSNHRCYRNVPGALAPGPDGFNGWCG